MKQAGTTGSILLGVVIFFTLVCGVAAQTWTSTGSMTTGRAGQIAVLLQSGKVLVAGGTNAQGVLSSAELYDPMMGTWTPTGSMTTPRRYHAATLLLDGRVLVTGGFNSTVSIQPLRSAELYDPIQETWAATDAMDVPRRSHTLTTLPNGKVLVVGGVIQDSPAVVTGSVELYDPGPGLFSPAASLNGTTHVHTATLLSDGNVLVVGGRGQGPFESGQLSSAQIYDPANGTWTIVGRMVVPREGHTATRLQNGQVLIAGGDTVGEITVNSAELFTPATGMLSITGNMNQVRDNHHAALLQSGQVLVFGGSATNGTGPFASAELYNPVSGAWTNTSSMAATRSQNTATVLPSGQVLAAGTASAGPAAELYGPSLDIDGPITSNVVAIPNPVAVNTVITLTATVDDTATGGATITTADYSLNGVSLLPMSAQDGSFDAVREDVQATIPAFTAAGVHDVCVAGTDAVGNTGSPECLLLAVYDPTAGFVTGGGWIASPLGAYTPDPALTGRANFGFVSKYQKGASTPTGVTEFQFNIANLNFHSATYQWLVVAGARAQYKGTGTINGQGTYGFMLTAIDGQLPGGNGTDKFRIKIWEQTPQGDATVYDNQLSAADTADPTTVIGGGSIAINAK